MAGVNYWNSVPVRCDIDPVELPVVLSSIMSYTIFINLLEIYNWTDNPVQVSVFDNQAPRIPLLSAEVVNRGVLTYKADVGRRMVGGISWFCSVSGVFGYVNGFQYGKV